MPVEPGQADESRSCPGVTILKPLHGDEPGLEHNLSTFCRQIYPGPVEIIFGVGDPADSAVAAVERLKAAFPDADIRLVADVRRRGRNGKVANLMNMAEVARHGMVVLADSDITVEPDYLCRVEKALSAPGVGAVTCLYRGVSLPNVWSKLATLWVDTHFLPNVLVGMALGLAKPCFGSTIALRRETLERIGGFASVKDVLADDYAIGEAVRALGLRVAVPRDLVLGHISATTSASALLRQELRWARTIRSIDPFGFAGSVVTHPVPLATLGAVCSGFAAPALAVLGLAVALRLLVQLFVARFVRSRPTSLILGPVRDYAAFVVFLVSFWPGPIDWRGQRFGLRSDGSLVSPDSAGS